MGHMESSLETSLEYLLIRYRKLITIWINYIKQSRFGTTYITAGIDYYTSLLDTKVYFSDYLSYEVDNELFVSKVGILHSFGPFYISADVNSENMNSYRLGFNLKL